MLAEGLTASAAAERTELVHAAAAVRFLGEEEPEVMLRCLAASCCDCCCARLNFVVEPLQRCDRVEQRQG